MKSEHVPTKPLEADSILVRGLADWEACQAAYRKYAIAEFGKAHDITKDFAEGYAAACTGNRWISVGDRLPELGDEVLAWSEDPLGQTICIFGEKDGNPVFLWAEMEIFIDPTHWQPLPEPPE